jgi:hypothetical protein
MLTKTTKAIESTKVNSSTTDVLLDSKIDKICAGLQAAYNRNLRSIINQDNIKTIISYIVIMKTEVNLSDHYRKNLIDYSILLRLYPAMFPDVFPLNVLTQT